MHSTFFEELARRSLYRTGPSDAGICICIYLKISTNHRRLIVRLNAMTHSRRQGINLVLRSLKLTPKLLYHYILGLIRAIKIGEKNKVTKDIWDENQMHCEFAGATILVINWNNSAQE